MCVIRTPRAIRSMAAENTAVGGGSMTSSCGLKRTPKTLMHFQTPTKTTSSQKGPIRVGNRAPHLRGLAKYFRRLWGKNAIASFAHDVQVVLIARYCSSLTED